MFDNLFLFFSGDLTPEEQTITQGFVAEMANSRGRGMCAEFMSESVSKEHLVIEVKKGRVFHQEYISQLRFMLMPAALHQRTSLGVLICAKKAVLEKCTAWFSIVKG